MLFGTPSGDYDDSYIVTVAIDKQGLIVSNDLYKDLLANRDESYRMFLKTHKISYSFVLGTFYPNPQFVPPPYIEDK